MGTLCCFALRVTHWQHFSTCFFTCTAIQGQKKWLHIRLSILLRPKWLISSCHPLKAVSQCAAGNTNWKGASWDSFGRTFLYRMLHLRVRWWCSQRSFQSLGGSVSLYRHRPKVPFSKSPDPRQTVLYHVQDMQVTAVCLSGAHGALEGVLMHD